MFASIRQIRAMSRATLLSLPRRLGISLSMVGSIALVVCVLTGFLALAKGFETTLQSTGAPDVAVVLGGGTRTEASSEIPAETVRTILAMGGDLGVVRKADGTLHLSRELVVPVEYRSRADAASEMLALRGMEPAGPEIRRGISLSAGRFVAPGSREVLVGDRLAATRSGFKLGDKVRLGPVDWTIAGHFSADGSAFESEIWGDLVTVQSVFGRNGEVQSLRLRLDEPGKTDALLQALAQQSNAQLRVFTESDLYADQSGDTVRLINLFGWPIALLMAAGAAAGALNTVMSSLSDRTVEIATVRALGFGRLSASVATWLEALLLSTIGAGSGVVLSWLVFNGWQASTVGANGSRVGFQLVVSADVMTTAGLVGLAIGAVGGALPAFAAARLPVTAALRARG